MQKYIKAKKDLSGKNFGRLFVHSRYADDIAANGDRLPRWLCVCSYCGSTHIRFCRELNVKDKKFFDACGGLCRK